MGKKVKFVPDLKGIDEALSLPAIRELLDEAAAGLAEKANAAAQGRSATPLDEPPYAAHSGQGWVALANVAPATKVGRHDERDYKTLESLNH